MLAVERCPHVYFICGNVLSFSVDYRLSSRGVRSDSFTALESERERERKEELGNNALSDVRLNNTDFTWCKRLLWVCVLFFTQEVIVIQHTQTECSLF